MSFLDYERKSLFLDRTKTQIALCLVSRLSSLVSLALFASMLLVSCENDLLVADEVVPQATTEKQDCFFMDCASGTNPDVITVAVEQKTEVPLLALQTAFLEHYPISTHLQRFNDDGYPAWDAITVKIIDTAYRHYLVPVYKPSSTYIEAVVSILHHLEGGFVTIDYLDRDNITSFPAFTTTRLGSKTGDHMSQRYTLEATVFLLSDFDKLLFGAYDMNIVNLLDEETRVALLGKDCKEVVNYPVYDCQDIVGGENGDIPLYTDCTFAGWVSEVTGTDGVGCGGGNTPPSGPGTGGTSGGGGGSGPTVGTTGPGVIIITIDPNDPNNRCIEDGVGCDEEEEEEEEDNDIQTDSIGVDSSILAYPCAELIVNEFLSVPQNDISEMINYIFERDDYINLVFTAGSISDGTAGTHVATGTGGSIELGIPPTFNAVITLNEDYLNATQDYIYATVLHEAIHAYYEGLKNYLGASTFNEMYPLFGPLNNSEIEQHEFMASIYVDQIAGILMDRNPQLRFRDAQNLAWEGLTSTEAYRELLGEERLNEIGLTNRAARGDQDENDTTNYRFIDCEE